MSQWPALGVYLSDGRIEIDNTLIETAIRPTAVGKKNWLFIGQANVVQRSAGVYKVIESCRRRGLDPCAYLRDVLTRLPYSTNWQIKDLTPEAWASTQRHPALSHASQASYLSGYDAYDSSVPSALKTNPAKRCSAHRLPQR